MKKHLKIQLMTFNIVANKPLQASGENMTQHRYRLNLSGAAKAVTLAAVTMVATAAMTVNAATWLALLHSHLMAMRFHCNGGAGDDQITVTG